MLVFGTFILVFASHNYYLTLIQTIASVFFYGAGAGILLRRKEKYKFLYLVAITQLLFAFFQVYRLIAIYHTGVDYNLYQAAQLDAKLYIMITSLFLNIPNLGILFLMLERDAKIIAEKNSIIEDERQQLKIANHTKDKFFSIIAHDLRGPISSMISMFDVIHENYKEQINDDLQKPLNALTTTSQQTLALLENLLTWSRSHSGHIEYQPAAHRLGNVIEDNLWLVRAVIQEKNLNFINNADNDVILVVDRAMLDTIIRNLLSNAIKYTCKDGTITISSKKNEQSLEISIRDTGVGMKSDVLENLFQMDAQNVSSPGTNGERGTGLGLILCKELVTKLNGKLEVISEENRGSVFTLTLPLN